MPGLRFQVAAGALGELPWSELSFVSLCWSVPNANCSEVFLAFMMDMPDTGCVSGLVFIEQFSMSDLLTC